jgi:hypothetical protein
MIFRAKFSELRGIQQLLVKGDSDRIRKWRAICGLPTILSEFGYFDVSSSVVEAMLQVMQANGLALEVLLTSKSPSLGFYKQNPSADF